MIEMKDLIAIVISILAMLISIVSLYISRFKPGELHLAAGEHTFISHEPEGIAEGCVRFLLAVNIANAGSKHLTVDRVALLIQHRGNPEGYLLEPTFYLVLAKTGSFEYDSTSIPITVFGGENVTKQVMFGSSTERPTEFQMTMADTYDLTLLAWLHGSTKPSVSDSFSLVVSKAHVVTLTNHIKEKKPDSVKIPQSKWRSWDAHVCKQTEVEDIKKALI